MSDDKAQTQTQQEEMGCKSVPQAGKLTVLGPSSSVGVRYLSQACWKLNTIMHRGPNTGLSDMLTPTPRRGPVNLVPLLPALRAACVAASSASGLAAGPHSPSCTLPPAPPASGMRRPVSHLFSVPVLMLCSALCPKLHFNILIHQPGVLAAAFVFFKHLVMLGFSGGMSDL